ncbi:hypothetical protein ACSFBE_12740 [Variovorax sp. ZT4R33]
MNTLYFLSAEVALSMHSNENDIQFQQGVFSQFKCCEYFFLGIPFSLLRGWWMALLSRCELRSASTQTVGEVPHRVRKVALRAAWPWSSVTLVNNVF